MKSILITIAISVYMTFMVVTIQVANKQTLATSDVTLDMITVMSRAFDEGGEGGGLPAPGKCAELPTSDPYWLSASVPDIEIVHEMMVQTTCGLTFFISKLPVGLEIEHYMGESPIGDCRVCKNHWWPWNHCCALDIACAYHWGGGGEAH